MAVNPFRPGFAERPAVIAGRGGVLGAAEEAFTSAVVDGRPAMPLFVTGPRGFGKTVVLGEVARRGAQRWGWPSVFVEASKTTGLIDLIDSSSAGLLEQVTRTEQGARLTLPDAMVQTRVSGVNGDVHLATPGPQRGDVFHGLLAELAARGSGLVLLVDEAHTASSADFSKLAGRLQQAIREEAPLVAAIGGLPGLRRRPADTEESVGYLERADWHTLGLLDVPDAQRALAETAGGAGRPMEPAAVRVLAEASGGYPYALQVVGKHAWRTSNDAASITAAHARKAIGPAEAELARNLYEGRWGQTSHGARAYLLAVAELDHDGMPATHRAVSERLGRRPKDLSMVRSRLMDRGTLLADGDQLQLMIPGFGPWIRAHRPAGPTGKPGGAAADLATKRAGGPQRPGFER